jgi:CspA family cold shock protein
VDFPQNERATLPHVAGRAREKKLGEETMATGTVKWFNTTKGFGFIAPDSGGSDVFVHISAVERSGLTGLADNQKVSYEMQPGRDGRESAVDLALL